MIYTDLFSPEEKCVFNFFLKYGRTNLYSDKNGAFAELLKILMILFGIKKLNTAGSNSRANGLTENCNELINHYLTSYVSSAHDDWVLYCLEKGINFH